MHEASTRHLNFAGTPAGWRRVAFTAEDGTLTVGMVEMPSDWDVEVHIDEATWTCFCIGVSSDRQQVTAERWLASHLPRRLEYADLAEQQAAMGGQDATTLDHAGIASALQSALTTGDSPAAVPTRVFNLTQVDDTHTVQTVQPNFDQYGDLYFSDLTDSKVWWFPFMGRLQIMRTLSSADDTRYVYRDGDKEIYFLYEVGTDYLLESVRPWETSLQRRHVQVAQASVTATEPPDIIEELDPQLVYDPNAFS